MSDTIDIKPVFASIRVKTESSEYRDDVKPKVPTTQDMVRRRRILKRRTGKKGRRRRKRKRKFKRKKRPTTALRPNTAESVRKSFIRNLGIDVEAERSEFTAVIPEVPSLPESDGKVTPPPPPVKDYRDVALAPPEDLLDVIMGNQEKMLSQTFKSRKRDMTEEERREKEARRQKRAEEKEAQKKADAQRRQNQLKNDEKRNDEDLLNKQRQALADLVSSVTPFSPPPKQRKSRFNDDTASLVNTFTQKFDNVPQVNRAPEPLPHLPIPITSNCINPALALLQQANLEQTLQQNALLQQQLNFEYLAAASLQPPMNPLIAQVFQNLLPQPAPIFLPQPGFMGIAPPPPPESQMCAFNSDFGQHHSQTQVEPPTRSYFADPPPPPDEPSSSGSADSKKNHVESIASLVKPYADKYGKRFKLSKADYKIMCSTIVKKVAKYNTLPKGDRIKKLVKDYAAYLNEKSERHKKRKS